VVRKFKMQVSLFPSSFIPWIHDIITSFLENRKASFRFVNARVTPKSLYMGVPQGAV
jgi:hypothetical protein